MNKVMLAVSSFSLVAVATFVVQLQTTAMEINNEPVMTPAPMASNTLTTNPSSTEKS